MAKLTPQQWSRLKKRRDAGESTSALAKEFGLTRDAIYKKLGEPNSDVKSAAKAIIASTETLHSALQKYTPTIQARGWDMAADLIEISRHSCKGALYSAMTFHKFAMIAHESADKALKLGAIDGLPDKVLADQYQASANEAFKPVASLIAANKDKLSDLTQNPEKQKPKSLSEFYAELN